LVKLFLVGANPVDLLLTLVYLDQPLTRLLITRVELQYLLEALPRLIERYMVYVLVHQVKPVLDLPFSPLLLDLALHLERVVILGIHAENFLDYLQCGRESSLREPGERTVESLAYGILQFGMIDLDPQHCQFRIDVSFGFEFGQDFRGELMIAVSVRFLRALDSRLDFPAIESLQGLASKCLL
jgi:hypothetical protein